MPVDKAVFTELLDALTEYYNRKMSAPVAKAWYKAIGNQMTTEQFQEAFERVILNEEYMPTPRKLLELIKGNSEELSLDEWEKCFLAASRGDREVVSSLSPAGQFALRSVGGIHGLGMSEEKDRQWLMKRFIEAWKSSPVDQRPALPAAQDSVVLPAAEIQALTSKLSMNGNGKH